LLRLQQESSRRTGVSETAAALDEQAREWDRCSRDLTYFINNYVWIEEHHDARHGDTVAESDTPGEVRFLLWAGQPNPHDGSPSLGQADLPALFEKNRFRIVLKARQLGISWFAVARALWKCLFRRSHLVLVYSTTMDEAAEMVHRARFIYARLPEWMKRLSPLRSGADNTKAIGFANGSTIRARAATKRAGRSLTVSEVIMDEAAWLDNGRRLYLAAMRAVEAGGEMTVISTANGTGGLFYDIWQAAYAGTSDFAAIFLPWWARPGRLLDWYQQQLRNADDPALIPQELPATPEEAFVSSGRVRFDPAWIQKQGPHTRPAGTGRKSWAEMLRDTPLGRPTNRLDIFNPHNPGHGRVLVCADTSEGIPGGDFQAAHVLDLVTGEQMARLHGHWEHDEFAEWLLKLGLCYGATVVVERNNHGHAVLLALRKMVQARKSEGLPTPPIALGLDGRPGWVTDQKTKPEAIGAIARWLRDGRLIVRDRMTLAELQDFRVHEDGSLGASEGRHDDLVMALACGLGYVSIKPPPRQTTAAASKSRYATLPKPPTPRGVR
jgi:hypothetical protein